MLGGCFGCGRQDMLFCFAPERPARTTPVRSVTKPPETAITASVDIPSRMLPGKAWPTGLDYGDSASQALGEEIGSAVIAAFYG